MAARGCVLWREGGYTECCLSTQKGCIPRGERWGEPVCSPASAPALPRPSPSGAAPALTLLPIVVSFVCYDKIINLQNHTLKAWDDLETSKGGIMRN